jgi:hypothetical protein
MYLGYTKHPQLGFDFSSVVWILYKPLKTCFSVFFGGTFTEHKSLWGTYEIKSLKSTGISFSKMCHIVFFLSIIGGYQPDTHWVSWKKKELKKNFIAFYTM